MDQSQVISLYQPMLQRIAYNFVKCKQDAEDIVQETFIKWLNIDQQTIQNTKAYLIKSVTNNCINHLNSFQKKKMEYLEALNSSEIMHWFKETNFSYLDLDIRLAAALRILNQKLEPLERAVYLLKEVFGFDYEDLQSTFDKKKDHCRQLFCRAKKKLEDESEKLSFNSPSKLVESFKKACHSDDAAELIPLLQNDILASLKKKS